MIGQGSISVSKSEKIDQLISIVGSKQQYESFATVGVNALVAKYGKELTESDKEIMKEESISLVKRFLETDMKNIYDKYLTETEIEDLINFYSSETGRRFRQIQPLITQEISSVKMNKYMEEFK